MHLLIEGMSLSLGACMELFKPHSSQCLFIREVWLDDVKLDDVKHFRRVKAAHSPVIIKDTEVSRVDSYKYLGFTIQHNMRWQADIIDQCKKATQRVYHLHNLKEFHVDRFFLLELFYLAVVDSILTYDCTLSGGSCTKREWMRMSRVVQLASKIIGCPLEDVNTFYDARLHDHYKARAIMSDPLHPLNQCYTWLPSRRGPCSLITRTSRFKNTFCPTVSCPSQCNELMP